jgi:hypothetical protein
MLNALVDPCTSAVDRVASAGMCRFAQEWGCMIARMMSQFSVGTRPFTDRRLRAGLSRQLVVDTTAVTSPSLPAEVSTGLTVGLAVLCGFVEVRAIAVVTLLSLPAMM